MMKIIISINLLVILMVLTDKMCDGEQRFLETPPNYQEVSTSDDIQIPCKVHDKKGQCIWQKDRKPVGMHPDKYEWASGRNSGDSSSISVISSSSGSSSSSSSSSSRSSSSNDADCTLLIKRASLEFDDGFWECQVTSGDFTRQDALTSLPSRLLVKVKPRKPRLEYAGTILTGFLTLRENQEVTISCVSRYGNPPALIKWFIGGDEVESLREQTNATEVDSPKTWAAHSLLRVRGQRDNHGLPIRCLSLHPSSPLPSIAESRLDVHYVPEVKLETSPRLLTSALEDSMSFMSIKCIADANPIAAIRWYKDSIIMTHNNFIETIGENNSTDRNSTVTISELRFEPVKRQDVGLYSCKGINVIGESAPANYRLDVHYGPRLMKMGRANETEGEIEAIALLASSVDLFTCDEFDANPPARYRWLHVRGGVPESVENNANNELGTRKLRLKNIVWSDEGEYRCVAFNIINGVQREMNSDMKYVLHISGPPEIQTRATDMANDESYFESIGWIGEPIHRLKSRFCSRPPPRLVAWQWGSLHIRAGESIEPKYEALPFEPITENNELTNCYWAILEIRNIQKEDAREYNLLIESEKGHDSTSLKLIVRDPTEIKIIAISSGIGLIFLFLLIGICCYSLFRARHRRYHKERAVGEEEEDGSIAADAFYGVPQSIQSINRPKTTSASKVYTRKNPTEGGLAVMYDYNQITNQSRTMSPEALKVRRAPVVLQPPTIV